MNDSLAMENFVDYSGPVNFQIRKDLLSLLRETLNTQTENRLYKKRCRYVLDELLANAHDYYQTKGLTAEKITLHLDQSNNSVLNISLTNTLFRSDFETLTGRISEVNAKSKEELKKDFQTILVQNQGEASDISLGLITARLKNEHPFSYSYKSIDNQYCAFCLSTSIPLPQD